MLGSRCTRSIHGWAGQNHLVWLSYLSARGLDTRSPCFRTFCSSARWLEKGECQNPSLQLQLWTVPPHSEQSHPGGVGTSAESVSLQAARAQRGPERLIDRLKDCTILKDWCRAMQLYCDHAMTQQRLFRWSSFHLREFFYLLIHQEQWKCLYQVWFTPVLQSSTSPHTAPTTGEPGCENAPLSLTSLSVTQYSHDLAHWLFVTSVLWRHRRSPLIPGPPRRRVGSYYRPKHPTKRVNPNSPEGAIGRYLIPFTYSVWAEMLRCHRLSDPVEHSVLRSSEEESPHHKEKDRTFVSLMVPDDDKRKMYEYITALVFFHLDFGDWERALHFQIRRWTWERASSPTNGSSGSTGPQIDDDPNSWFRLDSDPWGALVQVSCSRRLALESVRYVLETTNGACVQSERTHDEAPKPSNFSVTMASIRSIVAAAVANRTVTPSWHDAMEFATWCHLESTRTLGPAVGLDAKSIHIFSDASIVVPLLRRCSMEARTFPLVRFMYQCFRGDPFQFQPTLSTFEILTWSCSTEPHPRPAADEEHHRIPQQSESTQEHTADAVANNEKLSIRGGLRPGTGIMRSSWEEAVLYFQQARALCRHVDTSNTGRSSMQIVTQPSPRRLSGALISNVVRVLKRAGKTDLILHLNRMIEPMNIPPHEMSTDAQLTLLNLLCRERWTRRRLV